MAASPRTQVKIQRNSMCSHSHFLKVWVFENQVDDLANWVSDLASIVLSDCIGKGEAEANNKLYLQMLLLLLLSKNQQFSLSPGRLIWTSTFLAQTGALYVTVCHKRPSKASFQIFTLSIDSSYDILSTPSSSSYLCSLSSFGFISVGAFLRSFSGHETKNRQNWSICSQNIS